MLGERETWRPSWRGEGRPKTRDKERTCERSSSREKDMFPIYVGIAVDASERSKMVKRKGSSTSRPRARKKAAKGRSKAKTSERGAEDECAQLRREIPALQGKRAELSEKQSKLENQKRQLEELKRKLEELKREQIEDIKQIRRLKKVMPKVIAGTRKLGEQLQRLRREEEQIQLNLLQKSNRLKEVCSAREAENTQRLLEKLPQEVWGKILDYLDTNDLFPLALSCRYFRQKQKELVARAGQSGPKSGKPPLALKTTFLRYPKKSQPASVDHLRFCSQEKVSKDVREIRDKTIRRLAALHGYLPLLQELLKSLETLDPEHLSDYAYHAGESSIFSVSPCLFQLLTSLFLFFAARGGHLETLRWLITQEGFELNEWVFASACRDGNLEMLKWLRSEGCPWSEWACRGAAAGGQLEALRWLRSEGCPWNIGACAGAALYGHLEALKWLRSEGCPWDEYACSFAAAGGHLEMLKSLRSEGCPWNEEACRYAAEGGQLEILKWLRSEGCPWNESACTMAARKMHLDVLRWAIKNGCPYEVNQDTRPALESLGLA